MSSPPTTPWCSGPCYIRQVLGQVRTVLTGSWLAAWLLLISSAVHAHPLSPAALVLHEGEPGQYEVSFRRSELAFEQLIPSFPQTCTRGDATTQRTSDQLEDRFRLRCPGGLAGQTVRVLGLAESSLSALVYVKFASGQEARGLLTPAQPSVVLPKQTGPWEVFLDYLLLGAEHLLTGWDHLLFILGLMFLARGIKPLVFTLSAFTLGHSVTLCLAALSLVSVPQPPVELGIAASLVALALSLLASPQLPPGQAAWRRRFRLPGLAFALGLLHGLGFAGALSETGLPAHQIPVSLLGFNLGIECAQLVVVLPLAALGLAFPLFAGAALQRSAAYLIGTLSACWCIERALVWIG